MADESKPASRRPRARKADVSEELIAAVQEAADILTGKLAPARVHTPESIAAAAAERAAAQRKTTARR